RRMRSADAIAASVHGAGMAAAGQSAFRGKSSGSDRGGELAATHGRDGGGEDGRDGRRDGESSAADAAAGDGPRVAVIGFAGRFPGAANAGEWWDHLVAGVESITTWSEDELLRAGVEPELLADPAYVRARGVLAGCDLFDAALFGYAQ